MIILAAVLAAAAAAPPVLDPLAFFTGRSHGEGTIKQLFKATQPLRVTSRGRSDGRGGIVLDQTVRQGSAAAKSRRWVLRPTSPRTLAGTLTDASGPVRGSITGNALALAYPMKGGLNASQTLILQPGGRVLLNYMVVKKFGLTVATIEERITKD